jgi:hypothetical protein
MLSTCNLTSAAPSPSAGAPSKIRDRLTKEVVLRICDVGEMGYKLIASSAFQSQRSYNAKRGLKVCNILCAHFDPHHFSGKRILELGPGHYAFASLARHLGAEVTCVERDPSFAELGRHLGFKVLEVAFSELDIKRFDCPFDGLWMKGSFNACTQRDETSVQHLVRNFTDLIAPEGWGWITTVNKTSRETFDSAAFVEHRIEVQRQAFIKCGWNALPIQDDDRASYALNYTGSYYYFTRNLNLIHAKALSMTPKGTARSVPNNRTETHFLRATNSKHSTAISCEKGSLHEASPRSKQSEEPVFHDETLLIKTLLIKEPASEKRPFNRVSRLWKPTPEYWLSPWQHFVDFIDICKQRHVKFLTMSQALEGDFDPGRINLILDHHIDYYPIETHVMCRWELENDVVSSVYLFNQSPYQDTLQRKQWRVEDLDIAFYQSLEKSGFEIGYHQNAVGIATMRNQSLSRSYQLELSPDVIATAKVIFSEDVKNLQRYFNIRTFIPHGSGEANARLLDIPEDCQELVWVYNNARKNKTASPPLKWKNYSDSSGTSPQAIRGYRGTYVARRGNLLLAAWMLEPGLNHVLIHPGRFAKGMPYELYSSDTGIARQGYTTEEYALPENVSRPLVASSFLKTWPPKLSDDSLVVASTPDSQEFVSSLESSKSKRAGRGFLLTDEPDVLRRWLMDYDAAVPVLVYHHQLARCDTTFPTIARPINRQFHLPGTPPPADLSPAEATKCFLAQFTCFFNQLYSNCCLRHLEDCGIRPLGLVLHRIQARRISELQALISILSRMAPDAEASIRLFILEERAGAWQEKADSLLSRARKRTLPHINWHFTKKDDIWMLHITTLQRGPCLEA